SDTFKFDLRALTAAHIQLRDFGKGRGANFRREPLREERGFIMQRSGRGAARIRRRQLDLLACASVFLCTDRYQLQLWILNRLRKKALDVNLRGRPLLCLWCASHARAAAMFRTIVSLTGPAAPIRDKADATTAVWI